MSLSKENKVIIDGQAYYGGLNQPNLKFVQVNVDCWERIFDFLSLRDVLAMSQTCQRMRQIGGHYFREHFHGTACKLSGSPSMCMSIDDIPMDRVDFLRFIDTIVIEHQLDHLRTAANQDLLNSLTTLQLVEVNLSEQHLRGLENIQANIDTIVLVRCTLEDDSLGEFLALCPKLKSLRLYSANFKSPMVKSNLLERTYPTLDHVQYVYSGDVDSLMPFLERNTNIKGLQIGADNLCKIPLETTTIHLDYLHIDNAETTFEANEIAMHLKALHANGFFKKLRFLSVYEDIFDDEAFIRQMISFSGLETLCILGSYTNMCQLDQLKEMQIVWFHPEPNLDILAKSLTNLERLSISGSINQLEPFLRHSKKLKYVSYQDYFGNALDVPELNAVRKMSKIQRKVKIGLYEGDYLRTKSLARNIDFDLIEIVREQSIRKHFDC